MMLDVLPSVFTTASPAPLATIPTSDSPPTVSFVAVTYGTGPIIVDSLASLADTMALTDLSYECIVVDNPHPAEPHRAVRQLLLSTRGVRVARAERNLGFGGGCELGALHARGCFLAFVNPDIMFVTGWIEPLIDCITSGVASIAAPVLLNDDGSIQEAGQVVRRDASTAPNPHPPGPGEVVRCDYASAACWVMGRDEHERVGGFDPGYHPAYYEDVDLALRAAQLGGTSVVHGSSRVTHLRGSSTADTGLADIRPQRAALLTRWPMIRWTQAT